jgi:hypothetical protein
LVKAYRAFAIAAVTAAAACGLAHSVGGPVAAAPDATFSCAQSAINSLGFTVTRSQPETGFLQAERSAPVAGASSSTERYFTSLVVSVYTKDGQTQLFVTASREKQEGNGPRSSSGVFVSDSDKVAADSVVHACRK